MLPASRQTPAGREAAIRVGRPMETCSTNPWRGPRTKREIPTPRTPLRTLTRPARTNDSRAARGRRCGRDVRLKWPASSGSREAGIRLSVGLRSRAAWEPRHGNSSPVSSSPASGTSCAGAGPARAPGASTPARGLPCPPCSGHCARSPGTRRPATTARRTGTRRPRAGPRSGSRRSSRSPYVIPRAGPGPFPSPRFAFSPIRFMPRYSTTAGSSPTVSSPSYGCSASGVTEPAMAERGRPNPRSRMTKDPKPTSTPALGTSSSLARRTTSASSRV